MVARLRKTRFAFAVALFGALGFTTVPERGGGGMTNKYGCEG